MDDESWVPLLPYFVTTMTVMIRTSMGPAGSSYCQIWLTREQYVQNRLDADIYVPPITAQLTYGGETIVLAL